MKIIDFRFSCIILIISFLFNSCFPTFKATRVSTDSLSTVEHIKVQAKVFTHSNTIFFFPNGYSVSDSSMSGLGLKKVLGVQNLTSNHVNIPLDSIAAMITYEETTSDARHFGSFVFGLTSPILTILAPVCLMCPKCCFGSCPTVYTFDGSKFNLEAELFSECISKQLENNDIDLIKQPISENLLSLKITNEALETHYINKFEINIVDHPIGTEVYSTIDDELTVVSSFTPPLVVKNKQGSNISKLVVDDDEIYYRSGVDQVNELKKGYAIDYIDIVVPATVKPSLNMVMKYRNTLLSTTLLYDVVIGSQGIAGLEWTNRMNEDSIYAEQFKMIYESFSGIKLKTMNNGQWVNVGVFKDAGPLNWKYLAAEIPMNKLTGTVLRLEFIPDNFMIDYIAFDTSQSISYNLEPRKIIPSEIKDGEGNPLNEVLKYIQNEDEYYLKTEPGDCYYLNYLIPRKDSTLQTAVIFSKGYYNEWIRGDWISNNHNKEYSFDLYNIRGTLSRLADSWLENSTLLEEEFFKSKITLKEEQ